MKCVCTGINILSLLLPLPYILPPGFEELFRKKTKRREGRQKINENY